MTERETSKKIVVLQRGWVFVGPPCDDVPLVGAGMSVWDAIAHERQRAHEKHGAKSMENGAWWDPDGRRLRILLEEVGEVAKELNDADCASRLVDRERLYNELVQVAAMAAAWADACWSEAQRTAPD